MILNNKNLSLLLPNYLGNFFLHFSTFSASPTYQINSTVFLILLNQRRIHFLISAGLVCQSMRVFILFFIFFRTYARSLTCHDMNERNCLIFGFGNNLLSKVRQIEEIRFFVKISCLTHPTRDKIHFTYLGNLVMIFWGKLLMLPIIAVCTLCEIQSPNRKLCRGAGPAPLIVLHQER